MLAGGFVAEQRLFADWLMSRGDPNGEWLALHLAGLVDTVSPGRRWRNSLISDSERVRRRFVAALDRLTPVPYTDEGISQVSTTLTASMEANGFQEVEVFADSQNIHAHGTATLSGEVVALDLLTRSLVER
jgi:hypothetical protein